MNTNPQVNLVIPNLSAQRWLLPLLRGCWNHDEDKPASGSCAKRWIREGKVKVNGECVSPDEVIDYPVFSVVLNPKSDAKRVTIF